MRCDSARRLGVLTTSRREHDAQEEEEEEEEEEDNGVRLLARGPRPPPSATFDVTYDPSNRDEIPLGFAHVVVALRDGQEHSLGAINHLLARLASNGRGLADELVGVFPKLDHGVAPHGLGRGSLLGIGHFEKARRYLQEEPWERFDHVQLPHRLALPPCSNAGW